VAGNVVGTKVPPVDIGGISCVVPAVVVAAVVPVAKAMAIAVPESVLRVTPTPRRPCVPADVSA